MQSKSGRQWASVLVEIVVMAVERLLKLPDGRKNDDSLQTGEKNLGERHKEAKEHLSLVYDARQKALRGGGSSAFVCCG